MSAPTHVDGDELEQAILGQDAEDRLLARDVVRVHERYPSGVRACEGGAGIQQRVVGMDGDGRRGRDADGLFNLAQRSELDALDVRPGVIVGDGRHVVVLDEVDEAGPGLSFDRISQQRAHSV
jgi:hypothetical protein